MEDAEKETRIEKAWASLGEWFETLEPEAPIHLRFGTVGLASAGRSFFAIEKRALSSFTSSVWGDPETFDPKITGIERSLKALEARKILALSLHYEIEVKGVTFAALLTVARRRSGTFRARGYTRTQFFVPESASQQEKFSALLGHALELGSLLEASKVELGSSSGGEDSAFTSWRVRI